MYNRTGFQILHWILAVIIILNILDFLEVLNPFWDYIKKLVSWFLVAILFYQISPSKILVGEKRNFLDFSFVVAALALTINDMLRYVAIMREYLITNATQYVDFFEITNAGEHIVSVSQEAWNSLNVFGIIPDLSVHAHTFAQLITLKNPAVSVQFLFEGASKNYELAATNLSGSLLAMYNSILPYTQTIQSWGFFVGVFLFAIIAIVLAKNAPQKQSLLGIIDQKEDMKGRYLIRALSIFLLYMFFFLFVFSLVMEWLAIAIDAPILMIALLVSVVLLMTHKAYFSFEKWEEWVTNFGANIEPFVQLFMQKKTILLGLSGLLVLHLVTEVMNYIFPFTFPVRDQLYLAQLGIGHDNLFSLAHSWEITIAIANIIAWTSLLLLPAYIWYTLYKLRNDTTHKVSFSPWFLGLFSGSLTCMLLAPMITFKKIEEASLIGVDFLTHVYNALWVDAKILFLLGVAVGIIVFVLSQFAIKKFLYIIPVASSLIFMGIYAYLFFKSAFSYYVLAMMQSAALGQYVMVGSFALFLVYTAFFYASGYLIFLYEVLRD